MKKEIYLLFTSGRGPVECEIAVQGIQNKFRQYLDVHQIPFQIVSQQKGQVPRAMKTIVFKLVAAHRTQITPWMGTMHWICKSPIRKYHKRKNWYIKCEEIDMPEVQSIDLNELTIQSYKASGPGGQHRNKVETAIRIIHRPTGVIVTASDSKSKAQNKKNALKKLEERLKTKNQTAQEQMDLEKWLTKIEIERGNPIKVFEGKKFAER